MTMTPGMQPEMQHELHALGISHDMLGPVEQLPMPSAGPHAALQFGAATPRLLLPAHSPVMDALGLRDRGRSRWRAAARHISRRRRVSGATRSARCAGRGCRRGGHLARDAAAGRTLPHRERQRHAAGARMAGHRRPAAAGDLRVAAVLLSRSGP